ncbi:MAG: PAS domain S-box protein, partial [Mariprofundaceae bacterium]|nr:PAS domain S-box protein [Mariprofundaceae bacterium]
ATFAMYYPEPSEPERRDMELIERMAALAANAITHKRAEASIRQDAERMRTLLDADFDAVVVLQDDKIVYVNRQAQIMSGQDSPQAMLGESPYAYVHPKYLKLAAHAARRCYRTGRPVRPTEILGLLHGGRDSIPIEIASARIDWSGKPAVVSMIRDISERKAAEQALKDSEQRLRLIVSASPVPTVLTSVADGRVLFANDELIRMFGGIDEQSALQVLSPDMYVRLEDRAEMLRQLKSAGMFKGEVEYRRLNGDAFPALVSARIVQFDDAPAILGLLIDMTDQRMLEAQFRQAQKMESVGTLVGGIAHDFNNMLAGMLGQLYLVRHALQDDPAGCAEVAIERINAVDRQGMRAAGVISQLMTFARKGQVDMQRLDVNQLAADAMRLHRVSIPENIAIEGRLGDALEIQGDSGMIQQMLLNLLTNARDALEGMAQPHIQISLGRFVPDAAFREQHTKFDAGAYACMQVRDNGCGIGEEQISRIFDPFFTTKEVGKGTGLGLAMLYGGMQTHHGHVLVESTPGEGTCFSLYFPLLEGAGEIAAIQTHELVRGAEQTILLADDEPSLLEVMQQALEMIGYRVLTASNGKQALDVFTEQHAAIDLALLDVVMPVMSGVEAAGAMRELRPELPVIFHTGYGEEAKLDDVETWRVCTTVKKPVNIEALSRIIADML